MTVTHDRILWLWWSYTLWPGSVKCSGSPLYSSWSSVQSQLDWWWDQLSPLLSSLLSPHLNMFLWLSLLLLICLSTVSSHSVHSGQCPSLTPMAGFDWDQVSLLLRSSWSAESSIFQFSAGVWYVTDKFDTKSTCLTYQFKTDNLGFKSIEQVGRLVYWTSEVEWHI